MLDEFERDVGSYKIRLQGSPAEAGLVDFGEALKLLKKIFDAGKTVWRHELDTQSLRLIDLDIHANSGFFILLVSNSNARVPDPAFEHIENGAYRVEPKKDGEGVASSAHVLISSKPVKGAGIFHQMYLERVPGLGSSSISPFLTYILKLAYEGQEFEDASGRKRDFRPIVEINGDLSDTLIEQVKRGQSLASTSSNTVRSHLN